MCQTRWWRCTCRRRSLHLCAGKRTKSMAARRYLGGFLGPAASSALPATRESLRPTSSVTEASNAVVSARRNKRLDQTGRYRWEAHTAALFSLQLLTTALFSLQLLLAPVTHADDRGWSGSYSRRSSAGWPVVALVLLRLTQVADRRARPRGHHLLSLPLRRLPLRATAPSSWSRRTDPWD